MDESRPHECPESWSIVAATRLAELMGGEEAEAVARDTLSRLNLAALCSADDLYRFGFELERRGGYIALLGASLQNYAKLHGAGETAEQS